MDIIQEGYKLFKGAGFDYAICGGYALEMFAGKKIREHGDFDILVFAEDKNTAVQFLMDKGWLVFGRFMEHGAAWQFLFYKVNEITDSFWDDCKNFWAVKPERLPQVLQKIERIQGEVYTYQSRKWLVQNELEFIELELDKREGGSYIAWEKPRISYPLDKAILYREGVAYLTPELILFYKSDSYSSENVGAKPRTEADFKAIMPLLSQESKNWLMNAINTAYPDGHSWLDYLVLPKL